jgi:hypothetical protein
LSEEEEVATAKDIPQASNQRQADTADQGENRGDIDILWAWTWISLVFFNTAVWSDSDYQYLD